MNEDGRKSSGTKDIVDYMDEINEVRAKIMPLVSFLSIAVAANKSSCYAMTTTQTRQVAGLLRDMLGDLFLAVDGIKNTHASRSRRE